MLFKPSWLLEPCKESRLFPKNSSGLLPFPCEKLQPLPERTLAREGADDILPSSKVLDPLRTGIRRRFFPIVMEVSEQFPSAGWA